MIRCVRFRLLTALGLGLLAVSATALAAQEPNAPGTVEKQHTGTVVSAGGGKLVMTGDGGAEHTHMIGDAVTILIDNQPARLEDLKQGDKIAVTTGPEGQVLTIVCHRG